MTPQRPDVGDLSRSSRLNPEWMVGFIDGEGCFHIGISKHADLRSGYQILPELTVVQHQRDVDLLYELRSTMNCGVVRRNHGDRFCWRVRSLKNLIEIIIPFFDKYPLKSKKAVEFIKFRKVIMMMQDGKHLSKEGFAEITKIASEMNRCQPRTRLDLRESPSKDENSGC